MRISKVALLCGVLMLLAASKHQVTAQETVLERKNAATANLTLGVTEVALIRVNTLVISLQLNQQEAGLSVEISKADSTARLHMSSLISSQPRTLTAHISEGTVPDGTVLQLVGLQPNANFVGSWGVLGPVITLDNTPRIFISNITSCYSGTETEDGIPLKFIYTLDANRATYGNIRATTGTNVVVTLTLSSLQ